jgi:hypothetical protein
MSDDIFDEKILLFSCSVLLRMVVGHSCWGEKENRERNRKRKRMRKRNRKR